MSKSTKGTSVSSSVTVKTQRYPKEVREQAVELFKESLPGHKTRQAAVKRVAKLLGVRSFDTVLAWVKHVEIDSGNQPGVTSEAIAEIRCLRRQVAQLKRAKVILKGASVFSRRVRSATE